MPLVWLQTMSVLRLSPIRSSQGVREEKFVMFSSIQETLAPPEDEQDETILLQK
jgi:hypothetical protein